MLKSNMRGAEDEPIRANPAVKSKASFHGKGRPAPHLSHPGATAPVTGTHVAGHNENGHKLPVDVTPAKGAHHVTHNPTGGKAPNFAQTDRVD
jgi:hypothetical protein